jgi:hypothetical protein
VLFAGALVSVMLSAVVISGLARLLPAVITPLGVPFGRLTASINVSNLFVVPLLVWRVPLCLRFERWPVRRASSIRVQLTLRCIRSVCLFAQWFGVFLATVASCLLEATTLQIDNLFLPLIFHVHLMLFAR